MEAFLNRHAGAVIGVLSGFDRLVFRGTLRVLAHHLGMKAYLWAMQVLLKDFASHAEAVTRELREASEALARRSGRPIRFLPSSATNKEAIARAIARQDGIEQGLICIITAVEPCLSYDIVRDRQNQRLQLQKDWIMRGALDWASMILRASARQFNYDHLGQPWATPLADTRLDQYADDGQSAGDADFL